MILFLKQKENYENLLPLTLTLSSDGNNGLEESDGEVETKERPKKRGESKRIYLNDEYPSPWTLLPVVNSFEINNEQKSIKFLILELYGLDSRIYADEPGSERIDFNKMIKYSISKGEKVYKINEYLRRTFRNRIFNRGNCWENYEKVTSNRYEFFRLNLVNWKRDWYSELSLTELVTIMKEYQACICSGNNLPKIREVWIEDGKKWRVLAIAKPGVRLFLSGFNKFLMEYLDKILDRKVYHGFMHSRGVNTYWTEILEERLLESENIIEMDFSACFNNIRKAPLIESLIHKYKIPLKYIKLIIMYLNAEILQKDYDDLPSIDGQIERYLNQDFNLEERNLIQGLPICPILMNLAVKNGLDDLKKELKIPNLKVMAYADDISLFLSDKELMSLGGESFKEKLNSSQSFKRHGLKVDLSKSRIVKHKGSWKHDLKLLGLKYMAGADKLMSETRGRLENKLKRVKARESMSMELDFKKVGSFFYENLSEFGKEQLDKYLPNHHEIQSLNYKTLIKNEMLKKYYNTLVSYLFKGSEKVKQDFRLTNNKRGSIMNKIIKNYSERNFKKLGISIHVMSYFIIKDLVELFENQNNNEKENLILKSHSRIIKKSKKFLSDKDYLQQNVLLDSGIINEIRKFKIFLKYNNSGFIGYDEGKYQINYGEIDKFYKKAKELSILEREKILMEIKLLINSKK